MASEMRCLGSKDCNEPRNCIFQRSGIVDNRHIGALRHGYFCAQQPRLNLLYAFPAA
jgi:hypothetical protein